VNLRLEHTLHYTYSHPVFLSPHYLYLHPKTDLHQEMKSYELIIEPKPDLLFKNIDAEGNLQHIACVNHQCQEFIVKANFVIETNAYNPFDFIYVPFETAQLPFHYPEKDKFLLKNYLPQKEIPTLVHQFARQIASDSAWNTTNFLVNLSKYIKENFIYDKRIEGPAFSAEYTLLHRKGTCRDYAVLMIAACQALGIAARFVSGYCYGSELQAHELHAWVEAYLPGGGWRGFDPTEGKMTDNQYITLASSVYPEMISPVKGIYKGIAKSNLEAWVSIQEV
jgi:transglutaminase-like putative cysteine protease